MDFQKAIIEFLGIQDVTVENINIHRKGRKIRVVCRQDRESCFCTGCGLQFDSVKEWQKKEIKAPPLGVFIDVKIKFFQLRGNCDACSRSEVSETSWIHPEFTSMTMWRLDQWRMELMERRICQALRA